MRTILSIAGALALIGLGYALLQVFHGDVGAIFTWAWEGVWKVIEAIGGFFMGNPTFQKAVTS